MVAERLKKFGSWLRGPAKVPEEDRRSADLYLAVAPWLVHESAGVIGRAIGLTVELGRYRGDQGRARSVRVGVSLFGARVGEVTWPFADTGDEVLLAGPLVDFPPQN
jgi:hypothetical protein